MEIREMTNNDWNSVSNIYIQGIGTNLATFQTECPTYTEWDKSHIKNCRLVTVIDNTVVGWAAMTPVSGRCVYSGVAEISIYVDELYKGKSIGFSLLNKLCDISEQNGFWTLQSGIFEENIASIKLHEKCGFRIVGYREKIGKDRYGNWRNTVLMEKRSKNIF